MALSSIVSDSERQVVRHAQKSNLRCWSVPAPLRMTNIVDVMTFALRPANPRRTLLLATPGRAHLSHRARSPATQEVLH